MTRLVAAIVILLGACCFAIEASAHATLISVQPRDGSVVETLPKRVELRFSESVMAGAVTLIDPSGKLRDDAAVEAADDLIAVTVPANLPRGTSIVNYRVTSQDGHPVAGSVAFSVGESSGTKAPAVVHAAVDVLIWLTRVGLYLGLFAGIGGALFVNWITARRVVVGAISGLLVLGIVSAAASLGFQGLDALGLSLTDLSTPVPWNTALNTSLGPSLIIAVTAMAAAWLSLHIRHLGVSRVLAAIAFAGAGVALAASGHAATASPQVLTLPVVLVHALGVTFWLGALMPLSVIVWRERRAALPVIERFSVLAVPVVGLLALSGVPLAVMQL